MRWLLLAALAACGQHTPTDHEYCEQRQTAYEKAYPEEPSGDHAKLVDMCTRGVATEHGTGMRDGTDEFQRRLACSRKHLGKGDPKTAWVEMKRCESATLFINMHVAPDSASQVRARASSSSDAHATWSVVARAASPQTCSRHGLTERSPLPATVRTVFERCCFGDLRMMRPSEQVWAAASPKVELTLAR